jgi:hypothetical protein
MEVKEEIAVSGLESSDAALSDEARDLYRRLARRVVRLGLGPVAILFVESSRPLNFIGSQLLHFFAPFVHAFGEFRDYALLARVLEDRRSVDLLLEAIEKEEDAREKE